MKEIYGTPDNKFIVFNADKTIKNSNQSDKTSPKHCQQSNSICKVTPNRDHSLTEPSESPQSRNIQVLTSNRSPTNNIQQVVSEQTDERQPNHLQKSASTFEVDGFYDRSLANFSEPLKHGNQHTPALPESISSINNTQPIVAMPTEESLNPYQEYIQFHMREAQIHMREAQNQKMDEFSFTQNLNSQTGQSKYSYADFETTKDNHTTNSESNVHLPKLYNAITRLERYFKGNIDKITDKNYIHSLLADDDVDCNEVAITEGEKSGWTALHRAVELGEQDIVAALLEHKADINALDHSNRTPLIIAVSNWHAHIVDLLCSNGADVNIPSNLKDSNTPQTGWTTLHEAAKIGSVNIIKTLLHHEADINAMDASQLSPLWAAVSNGHPGAVELLCQRGADISVQANTMKEHSKWTLLHEAANIGDETILKILLDYKADINAKTSTDFTPLNVALAMKHSKVVKQLYSRGADITIDPSLEKGIRSKCLDEEVIFYMDFFQTVNDTTLLENQSSSSESPKITWYKNIKQPPNISKQKMPRNHLSKLFSQQREYRKRQKLSTSFSIGKPSETTQQMKLGTDVPIEIKKPMFSNINNKDLNHKLFQSVSDGDIQTISALLEQGLTLDVNDEKNVPLWFYALTSCHWETITLFLINGVKMFLAPHLERGKLEAVLAEALKCSQTLIVEKLISILFDEPNQMSDEEKIVTTTGGTGDSPSSFFQVQPMDYER